MGSRIGRWMLAIVSRPAAPGAAGRRLGTGGKAPNGRLAAHAGAALSVSLLLCLGILLGLPLVAAGDDSQTLRLGPLAGRPVLGERAEIADFRDVPGGAPGEVVSSIWDFASFDSYLFQTDPEVARPWRPIAGTKQIDTVAADMDGDGEDEVVFAWEVEGKEIDVVFLDTLAGEAVYDPASFGTDSFGGLHPNSNPWDYTRHERVLHLAAGQLDRDPEEEVVLAYWSDAGGAAGSFEILVYDSTGGALPGERTWLTVAAPEAFADTRLSVFDVTIGDFDADLIGEIALVAPEGLEEDGRVQLGASLFSYTPRDGETAPELLPRGGASFAIDEFLALDDRCWCTGLPYVSCQCDEFLDHVVAIPADVAPRLDLEKSFVGIRPDWLVVAVGLSQGGRLSFGGQCVDKWPLYGQLTALAFDRGAGPCGGDFFCEALGAGPLYLRLRESRTTATNQFTCSNVPGFPKPFPGGLCLATGQLSGTTHDDIAVFRYDHLSVFGLGDGQFKYLSGDAHNTVDPWKVVASSCDMAITDLDADTDDPDAPWRPEVVVAVQQTGTRWPSQYPRWNDPPTTQTWLRPKTLDVWEYGESGIVYANRPPSVWEPMEWRDPYILYPRKTAFGDLDGDAVRLGKPAEPISRTVLQPLVVMAAPPVHFDVLDGEIFDVNRCFTEGPCDSVSTYFLQTEQEASVSSTIQSAWSASGSVGFSGPLSASLTRSYGENFSEFQGSSETITVSMKKDVALFDQVFAAEVGYHLWEYPVFSGGEQQGFLTVVVPTVGENREWLDSRTRDGRLRYFAPDHEAGNLLSYRPLLQLPAVERTFADYNPIGTWLQPPPNAFEWSLSTERNDEQEEQEGTFSQWGISASATFPLSDVFDINLGGSYEESLETLKTTATIQSSIRDISVYLEGLPHEDYTYKVTPVVSWDGSGALVLDFAVDFDPASGFFADEYGGASDPAVSLPFLWVEEKGSTSPSKIARRLETRDIQINPADPGREQEVVLSARVHNYSLVPAPGPVNVKLYEGTWRTPLGNPIASEVIEGEIPAQRDAILTDILWTVPPDADLETLVLWIEIEPVGFGEIHAENNRGWRPVSSQFALELDADGDDVHDDLDNCIDVPNGDQLDIDDDDFGNACDCDFNQDGGCGQPDYSTFIACFGKEVPAVGPADDPTCEESDMNGDGGVGQPDYSLFISLFGGPPGPSGLVGGGGAVASAAQAPCGLGSELALLLPPLMWLWRRRSMN